VSCALHGASARTQARMSGPVCTSMHPYPFGQSAPETHSFVQYWPRQPKLHAAGLLLLHCRPVSSPAQYFSLPMASQSVPVMHCPVDAHVRVQRFCPPGNMARQTRGAAHSPSDAHSASSCFVAGPPVLLLLLALLLLLLALLLLLDDEVLPPAPELELDDAPPPPLELPVPPLLLLVPSGGTHCALTLQM